MPSKPVPRAVLEERLKTLEARVAARKAWMSSFGSYLALSMGVLASQIVMMQDDLTTVFKPVEIVQVFGALLTGTILYSRIEGGRAKAKDVVRVLVAAFTYGFTFFTLTGSWW